MPQTVTVGDTEVEIRETEGGFEAVEVEEDPEGLHLRAASSAGTYGCLIPLDDVADAFEFGGDQGDGTYNAAWDTDANVSDMNENGFTGAQSDDPNLDGYAAVTDIEVVDL